MKKNFNNIEKIATLPDVRDYLNHLTSLKNNMKEPISCETNGALFNVKDGDGNTVFSCTSEIYKLFKDL